MTNCLHTSRAEKSSARNLASQFGFAEPHAMHEVQLTFLSPENNNECQCKGENKREMCDILSIAGIGGWGWA
jgi:hypothetical protein